MKTLWKIVDENGDDVMSPDSILAFARQERRTPREVAQKEAQNLVNTDAGDAPVHAVKLTDEEHAEFKARWDAAERMIDGAYHTTWGGPLSGGRGPLPGVK